MKRAERGSARAAEQVFRTCELLPIGPGARVAINFPTFSGAKNTIQEQLGTTDEREREGERDI